MDSIDPFTVVALGFLAILGGSLAFVVHRANKKNDASGIPMSDSSESSYAPPKTPSFDASERPDDGRGNIDD